MKYHFAGSIVCSPAVHRTDFKTFPDAATLLGIEVDLQVAKLACELPMFT
jgi:hypothetical protein